MALPMRRGLPRALTALTALACMTQHGVLLACAQVVTPPPYRIYTVAGNGTQGFTGNVTGVRAENMTIAWPCRPAMHAASGTIFFSEYKAHVVRAVRPDDSVWTVAGTGVPGYDGDGMLGNASRVNASVDVELSRDGALLWIADTGNGRVRQVDLVTGIIITIAGTGARASGPNGVLAVSSGFLTPYSTATNSEGTRMWIAEQLAHTVRMLNMST
ncbi:hypothetical protein EON68_02350, partial [archaeon]